MFTVYTIHYTNYYECIMNLYNILVIHVVSICHIDTKIIFFKQWVKALKLNVQELGILRYTLKL